MTAGTEVRSKSSEAGEVEFPGERSAVTLAQGLQGTEIEAFKPHAMVSWPKSCSEPEPRRPRRRRGRGTWFTVW